MSNVIPSVRRALRNMIEEYRAASRPLLLPPPPQSTAGKIIQYPDRLLEQSVAGLGKIPPTDSGNGNRGSNVMTVTNLHCNTKKSLA